LAIAGDYGAGIGGGADESAGTIVIDTLNSSGRARPGGHGSPYAVGPGSAGAGGTYNCGDFSLEPDNGDFTWGPNPPAAP